MALVVETKKIHVKSRNRTKPPVVPVQISEPNVRDLKPSVSHTCPSYNPILYIYIYIKYYPIYIYRVNIHSILHLSLFKVIVLYETRAVAYCIH